MEGDENDKMRDNGSIHKKQVHEQQQHQHNQQQQQQQDDIDIEW